MCAAVNLPFHRYGQHLTADDGEKISRHIEVEVGKAKGGIGIVRRQSDGPNGRRCFVLIHENARAERARERLASGIRVASEVLNKEGRVHHPSKCHPERKRRDLTKTSGSHKLTWALNRVIVRPLAVCAVRDDTCYVPNEGRSSI